MKVDEAIREMGKAVLCLHIEVSESVAHDIQKRWNELMISLIGREREVRQEYDHRLREAILEKLWKIPRLHIGDSVPSIQLPQAEQAINKAVVKE